MRRGCILKLMPVGKGVTIEAEFDNRGILFLISNSSELSLCTQPDMSGLTHAIFLIKKGKVITIPLRSDALLKNEVFIELGNRKLRVILIKHYIRRRIKMFFLIFALLILSGVLVSSFFNEVDSKNIHPANAEQIESQTRSKTDFIEEAKVFMRAGKIDQARLALTEELDRNPTNEEALNLLKALRGKKISARTDELTIVAEAKNAYESGRQLMSEKEFVEAHALFKKAIKILSSVEIIVPFKSALLDVNKEALSMLELEMAPKLLRAKETFSAAKERDTKDALGSLVDVYAVTEQIVKVLPHNKDANSLNRRVRDQIRHMADRLLSAAQEVERLSGCSKAISEYESVARKLKKINSHIVTIANTHVDRCKVFVGGGL